MLTLVALFNGCMDHDYTGFPLQLLVVNINKQIRNRLPSAVGPQHESP